MSRSKRLIILIGILAAVWMLYSNRYPITCAINTYMSPDSPCHCRSDAGKNRVAVIIAEAGIYDTAAMSDQVSDYYASVSADLAIDNAGLKRFPGKTIDDLDRFIDALYAEEDVAYVLLVGDDLPVADVAYNDTSNLHAMYSKLECVNRDCGASSCSDTAISFIVPPLSYPDGNKTDFVLKVLETYTGYHNDFDALTERYHRSVLHVADYEGSADGEYFGLINPGKEMGYGLPKVAVSNRDYQRVADEMGKKHIAMYISVHGDGRMFKSMEMGLVGKAALARYGPQFLSSPHTSPYGTTLEEYLEFARENGAPALFVDPLVCGAYPIKPAPGDMGYCCWPQAFLESGVWAYYDLGGSDYQLTVARMGFSEEQTLGLAVRKYPTNQNIFFGDILAHMK